MSPMESASESNPQISIDRLQAELTGEDESAASGSAVAELVSDVESSVADSGFSFGESYVKTSLDELLLALVGLRTSDTHGKQLLDDLASEFDTVLSPGTVYPRLHGLCDGDVLEQRELVKTKEYTLADEDAARGQVAEAARQHLALGMVFHAALEAGEF
ncbi:helix-turn-helix transcriptional regulator [Natronomonas gomsonensis]|uniref:helix-turn-helix transcriptional regulator n=1 Tax=Natronomonas gomsonensis TaxID=1046043 RepID=UPI0015B79AA3|nr:helix-turn-helix transcriptional regulator [Natronomonas gomsonensis]